MIFDKNPAEKMIGKPPDQNQKDLFRPLLKEFINLQHPLALLSEKMDWKQLENEFAPLYSDTGTPAMPIRLMSGLLILKQLFDLGDETVIPEWIRDPYFQYFCGEAYFNWEQPCDPSDLVHFRKRIGETGIEKIFQQSISIHGKKAQSEEIVIDTTAQEKNITFPTDTKLRKKIIDKCVKIAQKENIELRQSYRRTVKKLLLKNRFSHHPKRQKEARKAQRKIHTISSRLVRELKRKFNEEQQQKYSEEIFLFEKVLNQKKQDKNKIYSLHEPEVSCIAKGKIHKPYEFGSKASFAITKNTNLIVSAVDFSGNPHDSKTLQATLNQHEKLTGKRAKIAIVDRGYQGKKIVDGTQILMPDKEKNKTAYEKIKARKRFRRRAAIEPIIGHLKHQYRMAKNYLKGKIGDKINVMLAAAAFNFKSWLNKITQKLFFVLDFFCVFLLLKIFYPLNLRKWSW